MKAVSGCPQILDMADKKFKEAIKSMLKELNKIVFKEFNKSKITMTQRTENLKEVIETVF